MGEKIKVLIVAKTYPLPSTTYDELVCTAGVKEDGSFIRLYPIDYRYRPYWQWYKKYQWVLVDVEKNLKDNRPESFRPIGDPKRNIIPLGEPLDTKKCWEKRKKFVLAKGVSTICGLQKKSEEEVSLGIIKPSFVSDLVVEETEREWKNKWLMHMMQGRLFGPDKKPLEKIPYKFSYVFNCEKPGCRGHKMMIEDWEIGQLYRNMRDKYGSEEIACNMVKDRFLNTICGPVIDTHFFVGTTRQFGTWVVIGTFWPKKTPDNSSC
jgi:hypothetical protein